MNGTLAVYRGDVWFLFRSGNGLTNFQFELPTDVPFPADDGDDKKLIKQSYETSKIIPRRNVLCPAFCGERGGGNYQVTNTADGDAGSLRQAVADATTACDSINFDIPPTDPNRTIGEVGKEDEK